MRPMIPALRLCGFVVSALSQSSAGLAADVPPRRPALVVPSITPSVPTPSPRPPAQEQQAPTYAVPSVPLGGASILVPGLTLQPSRPPQQQERQSPSSTSIYVRAYLCGQCLQHFVEVHANEVCYASGGTLCRDADISYLISDGPQEELAQECPICQIDYGFDIDGDGDGWPASADCDDTDPNRYPGNTEVCDAGNHDEDCDATTVGILDNDHDGFISSQCTNLQSGVPVTGDDCNDSDRTVHPLASEMCDGKDNNCDGDVDEHTLVTVYPDTDGDGFGSQGASAVHMCLTDIFQPTMPHRQFSFYNTDCNDAEPRMNPGAPEVRDNLDNDCNAIVDDVSRRN